MTNQEILTKAIQRAIDGGCRKEGEIVMQNTSEWLDEVFSDIRGTCEDCEHPRCLGRIKSARAQYADRIAAERAALRGKLLAEGPSRSGEVSPKPAAYGRKEYVSAIHRAFIDVEASNPLS